MRTRQSRIIWLVGTLVVYWTPAAAQTDDTARLEALRDLDRRVVSVMHRLSVANVELCPITRAVAGWTLHSAEQYTTALRPKARAFFGLQDGLPSVLALAPDSPAARAGLQEDDVLLALDDQRLIGLTGTTRTRASAVARADPASYAGIARQIEAIDQALTSGATEVAVQREGAILALTVMPVMACGYEAQVEPSADLNGGADGARISITSALVAYAASDDDLAFLLGHELAHNVLRHAGRPRAANPFGALFGRGGRTPAAVREAEQAADRVGMFLAARAGYDISGAAAFRRQFGRDHAAARYGFWGYPSAEERARAHDRTWREILDLQNRGEPLVP